MSAFCSGMNDTVSGSVNTTAISTDNEELLE